MRPGHNQLAEDRHGEALTQTVITYVPDYVVNAGGMMGSSTVIFTEPPLETSIRQIKGLKDTIKEIWIRAEAEGRPSSQISDAMATERINSERKL